MEQNNYTLGFHGKGMELFKIQIVNLILCIVTLGFYYPWAKAKTLQYLYSQTTFSEQPFAFTGTGKEMFKGFIKAIILLIIIYALGFLVGYFGDPSFAFLFIYIAMLAIIPIAIHGSYKYRMAKTLWQGIRFGYVGNRKELTRTFFKGIFLTAITLGIYGSWFAINIRRYIVNHIRVGNASFGYSGDGGDYFVLNLKGYLLTVCTLGIYFFWWKKDQFEFFVSNLHLHQGDNAIAFFSKATGGGYARLLIGNFFILVFTLGLGMPWTIVRTLNFTANNIEMLGNYSFAELQQAQEEFSDATGSDLVDILDLGFTI